jgi:DDE_Tnp_1-associated/Transposase DDE domain
VWWRCVGREKQRGPGRTGWSTKITVALGASLPVQSVTPCPPLTEQSCTDLLARFAAVPDPRRPRGIRHQVQTILAIAAAVVGGARSFAAIGEWATDAPQWVLAVLGARQDHMHGHLVAPHEATLRRTIQAFDAELLDAVISGWLAEQCATGSRATLPAVAADGKTVRGAWRPDGTQVHLLSAISHDAGVVLAQREIAAKTNEIPELAPLLAELDLAGVVVTADALHTQRATAEHLVGDRGAHYVLTVKGNQPTLFAACQRALSGPASAFAPEHIGTDRGHGRTEQRTTRTAPVTAKCAISFPHAAQVFRVRRDVGGLDGQRTRKEIAYSHHQPGRRASRRRTAGRLHPRPLADREPTALGTRRHLRRGPIPGPHRLRATGDGQPAQPRHQRPAPERSHQHRLRHTLDRPRPRKITANPRHHVTLPRP